MAYTRKQMVELALRYKGATTGSAKHKDLVNTFNKVKPHGEVGNYRCAWCAITVTAWFLKGGWTQSNMAMSYNCGTLISDAKRLGIWIENDAYVPKIGDVIIYYWSDSGRGDCTSGASHVGMVISVSGNKFIVLEGNKGSGVCGTRELHVNERYIRGFITPRYSGNDSLKTKYKPSTPFSGSLPSKNVAYGDSGSDAKKVQKFLNWAIDAKLDVDGECGSKTVLAIQIFEATYSVPNADGVFGVGCRNAANKLISQYEDKTQTATESKTETNKETKTETKKTVKKDVYNVIDVSSWQGKIDWKKVKADGIDGAIIRYADGNILDSCFDQNMKGAVAAGLHVGCYIYSRATSKAKAEKEAERLYKVVKKYSYDMPMYIDLEAKAVASHANTVASAFISKMDQLKGWAGIYANLSWFNNYLAKSARKYSDRPLWLAQYNNKITHKTPSLFGMWQYTSSGKVNGINGKVDRDKCYVAYWDKKAK